MGGEDEGGLLEVFWGSKSYKVSPGEACPSPLPSFLSPLLSPNPEPQGVLGPPEAGVASAQDPPADLRRRHLHTGAAGAEGAGEVEPPPPPPAQPVPLLGLRPQQL